MVTVVVGPGTAFTKPGPAAMHVLGGIASVTLVPAAVGQFTAL